MNPSTSTHGRYGLGIHAKTMPLFPLKDETNDLIALNDLAPEGEDEVGEPKPKVARLGVSTHDADLSFLIDDVLAFSDTSDDEELVDAPAPFSLTLNTPSYPGSPIATPRDGDDHEAQTGTDKLEEVHMNQSTDVFPDPKVHRGINFYSIFFTYFHS